MKNPSSLLLATVIFTLSARPQTPEKVNPGSLVLEDFGKRVTAYVDLHKKARSDVHGLKPTNDSEAITHYEHKLAHRIRELRHGASPGTIFTPDVTQEFRRLIRIAMEGSKSTQVQQSLNHAEPVRLPALRVDSAYPEGLPLQTTPPSFLLNLPSLPPEVEYRVVGHDLVLRDVDANLIVDLARNVVP